MFHNYRTKKTTTISTTHVIFLGWKLSTLFQSLWFFDWWIVGKKPQYSLKLGCGDNASHKADSCSSEDTEEQCSASLDTWWIRVLSTDRHKISSLQPISWGRNDIKNATEIEILYTERAREKKTFVHGLASTNYVTPNLNTKALLQIKMTETFIRGACPLNSGVSIIGSLHKRHPCMYAYWGLTRTHTTTLSDERLLSRGNNDLVTVSLGGR